MENLNGLRSQTGVKTWGRCDKYANKPREKRGPRVDGLCTAQSGRASKAMIKAGVVKPHGQVYRKETRKSGREQQDLLAAKPGRGSVSLDRRGRGAEKKGTW